MKIDKERVIRYLLDLMAIPSPCGFTDEMVRYVAGVLTELEIPFDLTRRGTIRAKLSATGAVSLPQERQARALVTHLDCIGVMVSHINEHGRIKVAPIGYWSSRFAEGVRVTLFSEAGSYRGTLLPTVQWGVSRDNGVDEVPIDWDHIELRLDEPVYSADDIKDLGISIGDFIALDSAVEVLENDYIVGRHLDNKAGVATLLELLHQLKDQKATLPDDIYIIFTITETIGSGVGSAILPEVSELVTVDFASIQAGKKSLAKKVSIASADIGGPFDYHLTAHLQALATSNDVPFRKSMLPAFHSDAASALVAGHDVRTAVVTYAGDASHSIERTHLSSLENMATLLFAYVTSTPTFSSDTEMTTVEDFPHQIVSENLPPVGKPVPNIHEVLQQSRDESGSDK